ncbi:NAD-dependent epimerase/dehydratase family protein [Aureimonas leprariae]|uniref:NAD-dependent epimerase/dehydratase family protein n=1 Tax=Plantimonas leprariae TaxID=2615207 RepID=A0A7V7PSS2_9HYPH|nr:NAD-dependent epimerase/dehydratase family protein [Aureimonas leprariae]
MTGAGGFVGRHFMARALAAGHEAVTLPRRADGNGFLPDWPDGVEGVVHLAALNPRRGDPDARNLVALRRANVEATRDLAGRAARAGVRRMVFVGSAAIHSPNGAIPVSEADAPAPRTPYALSKAEAETAFWTALAEHRGMTEGVVLRPVTVFGPGARNLTAALSRLARTPFPLPLGGLGEPRSLVWVESLCDAILLALAADGAAGGTFLVADDGPLDPAEIVAALREGAGRARRVLPAPSGLAKAAARLLGKGDAFATATGGLVVSNARARNTLGWRPAEAREALRAMAATGDL